MLKETLISFWFDTLSCAQLTCYLLSSSMYKKFKSVAINAELLLWWRYTFQERERGRGGRPVLLWYRTGLLEEQEEAITFLSSIRLLSYMRWLSQLASTVCSTSMFGLIYTHKPRKRFWGVTWDRLIPKSHINMFSSRFLQRCNSHQDTTTVTRAGKGLQ